MAQKVGNVVFEISASLSGLQSQLRTMESNFQSSFTKIQGIAKGVGGALGNAFGVGLSLGAVVGFGKEVLALADNLQNLHEQTGLSVQLLSGLKSPLEEAGSSMDAFAKGVFNLQKNLGNVDDDSDKVAQSIKRLGLNLNDLRNSSPDEFIKKVTDALGKIENPVERNTLLFNLLGKSAKELGPAFQQLAGRFEEFRAKGLTAADVKAIDDVGDALTRLKNIALAFGAVNLAALFRATGISPDSSEHLRTRLAESRRFAPGDIGTHARLERELAAALDAEAAAAAKAAAITSPFKGISTSAKSAKKDVDNLVDALLNGLEKQLASIEGRKVEGLFGPSAALGKQLDAQLDALKDNLRDKQLPIPKGLDEFFGVLKTKILGADEALRQLNDSLEETAKRQQALADEANEGVGIVATSTTAQQAAALKTAQDSFNELRQQLQIDSIDVSTPAGAESKRVALIQADFARTAQKIEEFARHAGLSNEESAEVVRLAWNNSLNDIRNKVDEVTEFQRRAMERAFDAGADLLKDALGGQIKTWEDFRNRVVKVIDEIAADWLTLQAKTLILGPDFGKSGGQVGGLLGSIGSLFGFGGAAPGLNPAQILANEYHTGGVAGQIGFANRPVDAHLYTYAPRYHGGIDFAGGEMPAVVMRGEEIGWPKDLAEKYGGTTVNHYHFNHNQFADRNSKGKILAEIADAAKGGRRHR